MLLVVEVVESSLPLLASPLPTAEADVEALDAGAFAVRLAALFPASFPDPFPGLLLEPFAEPPSLPVVTGTPAELPAVEEGF